MSKSNNQACQWKYNDLEDFWETQCDNGYQFMNDGPKENKYRFCPGCGKPVTLAGDRQPEPTAEASDKHVGISDVLAAADNFIRVLAIMDCCPTKPNENSGLRDNLPGVWPTVAELRRLIETIKAANAELKRADD